MKNLPDLLLAFFTGFVLMALINALSLVADTPIGIISIAFLLLAATLASIIAYCFGRRREKQSNLVAYNRGVTYGRKLGRAEKQSEIQKFLEEDVKNGMDNV
ncbi:MAG: hypothetical protein IJZ95_07400 [Oscillospiraceae bacterium]|nr:hypothetical protein [Oscillospiraceae bacterium]